MSSSAAGEKNNDVSLANLNVCFIGAGKMAQALANGMINKGLLKAEQIWASAPTNTNLATLEKWGCHVTNINKEACKSCGVIFLCVKPHLLESALKGCFGFISPNAVIVSVAAGVPISFLEGRLSIGARVIRVMPNTPCVVGSGVCAFARGTYATDEDVILVGKLLSTVSIYEEVLESQLDTVCGLSGSGPAYVYTFIQAMSDGAVKCGLPRALATKFAAQTVMGAAKMVLETGQHPAVLRDDVCSPGGTTIHGLHYLEKAGMRDAVMGAIEAAQKRCKELGKI